MNGKNGDDDSDLSDLTDEEVHDAEVLATLGSPVKVCLQLDWS
jgi:hypothetical protein